MKKIIVIAFAFLSAMALVSCQQSQPKNLDISGTWTLTQIQTKSVQIGDEVVDITVSFVKGESQNTFEMSQFLGQGRSKTFTGTWVLKDKVLSGKYSDGKVWASDYQVSLDESGKTLTMTPVGNADWAYVYKKM